MKKLIAIVLCVAMLAAMLCACGEKTPEQVMLAAQKKLESISSMSYDMVLDMEMTVGGMPYKVSSTATADMIAEPLQMKMDIAMDMGEMGSMATQAYVVMDGEKYISYAGMDMGTGSMTWVKQEMTDLDTLSQYDAKDSMDLYISSASSFVKIGAEKIGEIETTRYDGAFTGEAMKEALSASGMMAQFAPMGLDADTLDSMLSDLGDLPISIWVDSDYMPIKYDMDMTALMQSIMAKLMESMEGGADAQLEISKVSVSMTMNNINGISEIVIPEEALNAQTMQ